MSSKSLARPAARFSAIKSSMLATATRVLGKFTQVARGKAASKANGSATKRSISVPGCLSLHKEKTVNPSLIHCLALFRVSKIEDRHRCARTITELLHCGEGQTSVVAFELDDQIEIGGEAKIPVKNNRGAADHQETCAGFF